MDCDYSKIVLYQARQLDAPPKYPLKKVEEEVDKDGLYPLLCPKCTGTKVEKLCMEKDGFSGANSGGLVYRCYNPECGYMW